MSWLASCVLYLFHVVYYLINVVSSYRASLTRPPNPLSAKRKQVPTHLALLLTTDKNIPVEEYEEELLENAHQAVSWCRAVGIQRLTVYDREGQFAAIVIALRPLSAYFCVKERYTIPPSNSGHAYTTRQKVTMCGKLKPRSSIR